MTPLTVHGKIQVVAIDPTHITLNSEQRRRLSELAEAVGTKQQVIARLEDADYEGHSLSMLRRIAEALDHRLELKMVPNGGADQRGG